MDQQQRSDAALARAARLGDTDAFAVIIDRHGPVMRRYARFILGNDDDASDATQEALVSAWRSLDGFRGESTLRTWLFTLVSRRAADLQRKRKPTPLEDEALELHIESASDVTLGGAMESELLTALRAALQELPILQRSCWLLREIEGNGEADLLAQLASSEIATALSITPASVRGLLHRSREALATRMEAWR